MTLREAFAEKIRAALTRVAIRDYYDIDLGLRRGLMDPADIALAGLVRRKLAVPRTMPLELTEERLEQLRRQIATDLHPILRSSDEDSFDFNQAIATVRSFARHVRA
jgi:predicted nucleotidyltransferase component of viral defense system